VPIIDADTHVDETEGTWEFVLPGDEPFKPVAGFPRNPDPNRPPTRYWVIDGKRQMRMTRDDAKTQTTTEMRELLDVSARLRAMDARGVDIQVIYPTMFLVEGTDKAEVDLATRRSYNRWLADRCAQSGGRLRWVCLPPLRNMDKALEELRFARDHGACGVLKKGNQEADKWPADPYFFPLYEEAERLDVPICFHAGSGVPDFSPVSEFQSSVFLRVEMSAPNAFEAMIKFGITKQFPKLRFGFIEAGASWVPYLMYFMRRRTERLTGGSALGNMQYDLGPDAMRDHRFFVTCQVDEDLPYILQFTGEDNLITGSDFSHADAATEPQFKPYLRDRASRGEISETLVRKITQDNPLAFYGL
jgi:predicted TIM-barrel fold metal-dependent hydrolase